MLIGYGFARYRAEGLIPLWYPPAWTRHIVVAAMWPASIAVVAAYIPGDIKRVLKHPMLVGVKIWAVAHLCANGDLGGIILFGAVLAWAVYDRITLEAAHAMPGRRRFPIGGRRNDIIAIIVGTILYSRSAWCSTRSSSECRHSARRRWDIDRWCNVGA